LDAVAVSALWSCGRRRLPFSLLRSSHRVFCCPALERVPLQVGNILVCRGPPIAAYSAAYAQPVLAPVVGLVGYY